MAPPSPPLPAICGAVLCAAIFSYLLLLGALLSDRSSSGGEFPSSSSAASEESKFFDDSSSSDDELTILSSQVLEKKEKLFSLVNDKEWRILPSYSNSKRSKREIDEDRGEKFPREKTKSPEADHDDDDLGCEEIWAMVPTMDFLGSGWTKAVYKANTTTIDRTNRTVAVKTVDMTGQDMTQCTAQEMNRRRRYDDDRDDKIVELCYQRAAKKLIKEIAVLKLLMDHPNVVKILGYCVPKRIDSRFARNRVSLVTELGESVNLIRLLQMSWEDRLRIVLGVARLMDYLSRHPSGGSLVLNDMRRQQFVISSSDGQLKLVDVDDVGLEEPPCRVDEDCRRYLIRVLGLETEVEVENVTVVKCSPDKVCSGANELRNIHNAARHFTTFLLPYGAPNRLQSEVDQLQMAFRTFTFHNNNNWTSADRSLANRLKIDTERLVHRYASGAYLNQKEERRDNETVVSHQSFVAWPDSDLPGQFDYPCESSFSQVACSLSVANVAEARALCAQQPACRAFVWVNDQTSWTGRTLVHFKNDVRTPSKRPNATLYVKIAA